MVIQRVLVSSGCRLSLVGSRQSQRIMSRTIRHRSFSSNGPSTNNGSNNSHNNSSSMDDARVAILQSSLEQVHTHGWTEDAIAAGVMSLKYPPSMMGMVSSNDIVQFFMDDCNRQFKQDLDGAIEEWNTQNLTVSQRIVAALQMRLQYVVPFVDSKRWHEGMALGAMPPTQMSITASQLESMISTVCSAVIKGTNHPPLTTLEQTGIGAVYVATELHLLSDESEEKQDTWSFLRSRMSELELVAQSTNLQSVVNGDAAIATMSVAASLGTAVLSLAQPAARGVVSAAASTVEPRIAAFLQQGLMMMDNISSVGVSATASPPGTKPSDYENNLPPFPSETKK